jgi:hypothetical protein
MPRYLLEIIVIIILVLWLTGWFFSIAGDLIHILLVVILAIVVIRLLQGRN